MQLSDQHIGEFIELYKKHYGIVLDRDSAIAKGLQLVRFVELVELDQQDVNEYDYEKINS